MSDAKNCAFSATLKSHETAASGGKAPQIYGTSETGTLVAAIDASGNPTSAGLAASVTC